MRPPDAADPVLVFGQRELELVSADRPQFDGLVVRAGDELLTVRREMHAAHRAHVRLERL